MTIELEKRFWSKVDVRDPDDCWPWTATRCPGGYGSFSVNGKKIGSNRVGWELVYGPIPPSINVLHSCDSPRCCNPLHWFLGTQRDNIVDMLEKHREARGEMNGRAKLTKNDVLIIRKKASQGVSRIDLAKVFGLAPDYVGDLINRKSWKHI